TFSPLRSTAKSPSTRISSDASSSWVISADAISTIVTTPLTNATQRNNCILYNSLGRRYRRSNADVLTGPGKLYRHGHTGRPFFNMRGGIAYAVQCSMRCCAIEPLPKFLLDNDCSTVGNPKQHTDGEGIITEVRKQH